MEKIEEKKSAPENKTELIQKKNTVLFEGLEKKDDSEPPKQKNRITLTLAE